MEKIKEEFRKMLESGKIPVFEIEVKRNSKQDYILFHISIRKNTLRAEHEALTEAEEKSNKIAFKSVDIDPDFGLNWHLEGLFEECTNAILESEFVELV